MSCRLLETQRKTNTTSLSETLKSEMSLCNDEGDIFDFSRILFKNHSKMLISNRKIELFIISDSLFLFVLCSAQKETNCYLKLV